ncbi:PspA/IM30 family protein [Prochlorococcus sp. MIT 1223]|uniref:PspA/IM30 family protein n=1 Tax=Prochlorococcus sp. MIT 1223 TaxID=3096217 RepID=UPI002A76315A|nr:PspA/IM30 family protein [Prochlorococcus sp. MIT 1223]
MGFFDKLSRLFRANLNDLVSKAEDPAKILDQSMADMQNDLVKLRQAVAMAIASQRRLKNQFDQGQIQIKTWYERAEMALLKGEDTLAREALTYRKSLQENSKSLIYQLESQDGHVQKLKKNLLALEGKISEVKTKKDMLKARAQAAKAQKQLENVVGNMNTNSAMAAFERMQDKVESMEASSEAAAELAQSDLESKFAALDSNDDIEEELNQIREGLKAGVDRVALPEGSNPTLNSSIESIENEIKIVEVSEIDSELEELRKNLKKP